MQNYVLKNKTKRKGNPLKSGNNRCIFNYTKRHSGLEKGKRIFNIRKEKIEYKSEM